MKDRIHRYLRPGIVHFMAYPVGNGEGPILETLASIVEDCFFEVVEITWIKDSTIRNHIKRLLASSGMQVRYGAYPRILSDKLDLNSVDEAERQRAVNAMREGIDEAVELGATNFGLMSGPYKGHDGKAASMDALERSLIDVCRYAEDYNVEVALEPFDREIDKRCLIGPVADAKEIVERVKGHQQNFGLIVDLSHIPLLGESPQEALRPIASHLVHAHIGNCCLGPPNDPAFGDKHPRFGYPTGVNDVPEIVAFLEELFNVGYLVADGRERRTLSFEIKPVGDESSEAMIAGAKRKLREAWNCLE